jgi:hypothetical protein
VVRKEQLATSDWQLETSERQLGIVVGQAEGAVVLTSHEPLTTSHWFLRFLFNA